MDRKPRLGHVTIEQTIEQTHTTVGEGPCTLGVEVPVIVIPVVADVVTRGDKLEHLHAVARAGIARRANGHDGTLEVHHSQTIAQSTLIQLLVGDAGTACIDLFLIARAEEYT